MVRVDVGFLPSASLLVPLTSAPLGRDGYWRFLSVLIWEMLEPFTVCVVFLLIYILNKLCIIICFHSNGESSYVLRFSQFRHNYPKRTKSAILISEKLFFINLKFQSFLILFLLFIEWLQNAMPNILIKSANILYQFWGSSFYLFTKVSAICTISDQFQRFF